MITFTQEQKEAINTVEGNVLTIASAGSGKTSAFVTRVANMIHTHEIDPSNILAFTFTKKATEEIQKRLTKMIGKTRSSEITIGTFHAVALRMLKESGKLNKIKICPEWWMISIFNDMCKPFDAHKNHRGLGVPLKAGELSQFISYQKANLRTPDDKFVMTEVVGFAEEIDHDLLRTAYRKYEDLKKDSLQIDFADILYMFYKELRDDAKFRKAMQDRFQYVLVDEFQDTSLIVVEIIKMINTKNVFVVGDFRQGIYSFINADISNILEFENQFDDVKLIELNKNFRSTQNIVKFSNKIIANSDIKRYEHFQPSVSVADEGSKVMITLFQDEAMQARSIAIKVKEMIEDGCNPSEIAVLVRANSHTVLFEEAFADRRIPFDVSKSISFFDRKEIVDLLSYTRLVADSTDNASFRRVINSPNRYLSKQFVEDLEKFAVSRDLNLLTAIKVKDLSQSWKFKRGVDNFLKVMSDISVNSSSTNAGRFLRNVVRITRYKEFVNETTGNANSIQEKQDAIERLCEIASKFPSIKAFLAHVQSITERKNDSKGKDAVNIMTVHASKGLEFDHVFVPNVNEDMFPHTMNPSVEEERRLFYVACSRPRLNLFVSWFFYDKDYEKVEEGEFITELLGKETTLEMKKRLFRGEATVEHYYEND